MGKINKEITDVYINFKELEKKLTDPILDYKSVKNKYNEKTLAEVRDKSIKTIKDIRDTGLNEALKELERLEKKYAQEYKPVELSVSDVATFMYLIEHLEDEDELKNLYMEIMGDKKLRQVFVIAMENRDLSHIYMEVDIEVRPKELDEIEKAKTIIKSLGMEENAYPIIDAENLGDYRKLNTIEYQQIAEMLD